MLFPDPVGDTLEIETAAYWRQLPTFGKHEGEYVVMQGETPLGFFACLEVALEAGYQKYGLGPFLVKRVVMDEMSEMPDPVPTRCDFHADRSAFKQYSS